MFIVRISAIAFIVLLSACTSSLYGGRLADKQITNFNIRYYGYERWPIFIAEGQDEASSSNVRVYSAHNDDGKLISKAYAFGSDPQNLAKIRLEAYMPRNKAERDAQLKSFSLFNTKKITPGIILAVFSTNQLTVGGRDGIEFITKYMNTLSKAGQTDQEQVLSYNGKNLAIKFSRHTENKSLHTIVYTFTLRQPPKIITGIN